MSDDLQPGTDSNHAPSSNGRAGAWGRAILFLALIAAILYAGNAAMRTLQARDAEKVTEDNTVRSVGLVTPTPKGLAEKFTDSQSRLLADPPAAADQLVDPDPIVVAHIEGDSEAPGIGWKAFEKDLSAATGRKVVDKKFDNSADQLAEINKGGITILALHAADTPFLVDNYGFQPVAVLADQSGVNGNHLDIIVPANSPISSATDLKGHSLVCTVPASITGYRAAVALLMENQQMRPERRFFRDLVAGAVAVDQRSRQGRIRGGGGFERQAAEHDR
jgi:ABC transporter, phosphonate, periplasmic substrate-binding protein